MRVSLKELQKAVGHAMAKEKAIDVLREEITRVLGPSVIVNVDVERLAKNANDRIDVLERTGRNGMLDFRPNVFLKLTTHSSAEVRRLVARVLPEQYVACMRHDKNVVVRHTVAHRLPSSVIKEMRKTHPRDDELANIYQQKRLIEEKIANDSFDMYGEEKLGDVVKFGNSQDDELTDQWYATLAHKLIINHNGNIDGQWKELTVRRYCASMKATSGIDVDEKKLLDQLLKQLKEKDDRLLARCSLKEIARALRESVEPELPVLYAENKDSVEQLLESNLSAKEYVNEASSIFSIRESEIPRALRKFCILEGSSGSTMIPCTGKTPGNRNITSIDEQALDTYVRNWNTLQSSVGDPIRIGWSTNPIRVGAISFTVELK